MSVFDDHRRLAAPDMVAWLGAADAVRSGAASWPAVVGAVRVERLATVIGGREIEEDQETSLLKTRCPPAAVGVRQRLLVPRHASGDPATAEQETFTVTSIESQDELWTTVRLARRPLAAVRRPR